MNSYFIGIEGTREAFREISLGVILSLIIAMAASFISVHYGGPTMLLALLIGMSLNFFSEDVRCNRGILLMSRTVLRVGIALLGLRITFANVMELGYAPIIGILATVTCTILFGVLMASILKLNLKFGVLSGSAVAICGASAALAISSILPPYKEREDDTLLVVIGVTTLSTLAMVFYPIITNVLELSDFESSFFLGGTIHDVAQVVGAGYILSEDIGDYSTLVKLLRVGMLVPITIGLSFVLMLRNYETESRIVFPWFLLGFVVLVVLNSVELISEPVKLQANDFSRGCLLSAVAALGMKTSLQKLGKVGFRPFLLLALESVFIVIMILAAIFLMR